MQEAIRRLEAQQEGYIEARKQLSATDPLYCLLDAKLVAIEDAIALLRA